MRAGPVQSEGTGLGEGTEQGTEHGMMADRMMDDGWTGVDYLQYIYNACPA